MRGRKALMRKTMCLAKEGGALSSVSGCLRMIGDRGFKKKMLPWTMFYNPPKC